MGPLNLFFTETRENNLIYAFRAVILRFHQAAMNLKRSTRKVKMIGPSRCRDRISPAKSRPFVSGRPKKIAAS